MAITVQSTAASAELLPHEVLRPICVAGERREVGEIVQLTKVQGSELASAAKVRRISAAEAALKAPAKKPGRGGKAKAAEAASEGDDSQTGGEGSGDYTGA